MRIIGIWGIVLLQFVSGNLSAQKEKQHYEINKDKSYVKWSSMDGETEYAGSFKLKSGYIDMEGQELKLMTIFVDTKSFTCQKCGDPTQSKLIVNFVNSPQFLNSGQMDYASFKMFENKMLEKGLYHIKGQLSMIGYSNDVEFDANVQIKKEKLASEAEFTINRDQWELRNPDDGRPSHPSSIITLSIHIESKD